LNQRPRGGQVAEVASYVNRITKLVTVFMTSHDDTNISASILVSKPEEFKNHFKRMVAIIWPCCNLPVLLLSGVRSFRFIQDLFPEKL
jgi:hypothetical protein